MQEKQLSRRDFNKLLTLFPAVFAIPPKVAGLPVDPEPNVLVVVYDAWSASNTSLYGYARKTTPNIDRLADKAIVYHEHFASGHYTYPSTASFFTGVHPWEHQGYWVNPMERIRPEFKTRNLFTMLDGQYRFAYTHNGLAADILQDMISGLDLLPEPRELAIRNHPWYETIFGNDQDISTLTWGQVLDTREKQTANSLFFSRIYSKLRQRYLDQLNGQFPRGVPALSVKNNFILETATDWVVSTVKNSPRPFFGYIHLFPPHDPYRTRADFIDAFLQDGYQPVQKPMHPFNRDRKTPDQQSLDRRYYDEYLLYVDAEFGRLMQMLGDQGALEDTIVILTSDHGEMFERGVPGHLRPAFYLPLLKVPLIIFLPGQEKRVDIHTPTMTIDLLPTILNNFSQPLPDWIEGKILPPFGPDLPPDRTIYTVDLWHSPKDGPIDNISIMVKSGDHKFTLQFGNKGQYPKLDGKTRIELFNLADDPEELHNLYHPNDPLSQSFLDKIKQKLEERNLKLATTLSI